MKCAVIQPNLLVGPRPDDAGDFDFLKTQSVTAILSLLTADDVRYIEPGLEARLAKSAALLFRNVPVTDFDDSDLTHKLRSCVDALDGLLAAGHTVYLHCTAGVTRSPTVAAAYLHWRQNWPLERAVHHVQTKRNCCPRGDLIELAGRG